LSEVIGPKPATTWRIGTACATPHTATTAAAAAPPRHGPVRLGKSTLLHCLAGLDRLTSGQVLLCGISLGDLSDKDMTLLRCDRIGFVF
jgi:putative ABC transport system ATP-binding protein